MSSDHTKARRNWTDIAGFAFYIALAASALLRIPRVGILLLPAVLHEILVASGFLLRRPLRRTLQGLGPRLAAYSGTFLLVAFVEVARRFNPAWIEPANNLPLKAAGFLLWLAGSCFSLWTVWSLRACFSVEPQARTLITTGPFGIARHPTYGSYMLEYIGLWLINPGIVLGIVVFVWLGATFARMRYEEQVLCAAFPEYEPYRARVGALGFRLRRKQVQQPVVVSETA